MHWIRSIVREVFGLFVDDGSFALATLVWLAIVWFGHERMSMAVLGGIALFIGLILILIESLIRFSRRATK